MAGIAYLLKKGQKELLKGNVESALEYLRSSAEQFPDDPRSFLQLLRAYMEKGLMDEAGQVVSKLEENFSDNPTAQLFCGKFYFRQQEYAKAIELFENCQNEQPENLICKSYLYLTRWISEENLEALKELLAMPESSNLDFLSDYSVITEKYLIGEIRISENVEDVTENEEEVLDSEQDVTDESSEVEISSADQKKIRTHIAAAVKLYEKRDFEGALEFVRKAHELAPDDAEVCSGMGEALFYLNRFDEAEPYFQKILKALESDEKSRDDDEEVKYMKCLAGYTMLRNHKALEAMELLKQVTPFGPDDYMGFYYRGICYAVMGDEGNSRKELTRAFSEFQYSTKYQCLTRLRSELEKLLV